MIYIFFASLDKGAPLIDPPPKHYRLSPTLSPVLQLHNKTLLMKTLHTHGIEDGESWCPTRSFTHYWLAFIMLKGVRNTTRGKSNYQAMTPASYSNYMPARHAHQYNSSTNIRGITNDFLIRCDGHSIRWNPHLVFLIKPRTCD